MGKFPLKLSDRLKQFLCKHELTGKATYTEGYNSKEGYDYVVYECHKCGLCYGRWEKHRND